MFQHEQQQIAVDSKFRQNLASNKTTIAGAELSKQHISSYTVSPFHNNSVSISPIHSLANRQALLQLTSASSTKKKYYNSEIYINHKSSNFRSLSQSNQQRTKINRPMQIYKHDKEQLSRVSSKRQIQRNCSPHLRQFSKKKLQPAQSKEKCSLKQKVFGDKHQRKKVSSPIRNAQENSYSASPSKYGNLQNISTRAAIGGIMQLAQYSSSIKQSVQQPPRIGKVMHRYHDQQHLNKTYEHQGNFNRSGFQDVRDLHLYEKEKISKLNTDEDNDDDDVDKIQLNRTAVPPLLNSRFQKQKEEIEIKKSGGNSKVNTIIKKARNSSAFPHLIKTNDEDIHCNTNNYSNNKRRSTSRSKATSNRDGSDKITDQKFLIPRQSQSKYSSL